MLNNYNGFFSIEIHGSEPLMREIYCISLRTAHIYYTYGISYSSDCVILSYTIWAMVRYIKAFAHWRALYDGDVGKKNCLIVRWKNL